MPLATSTETDALAYTLASLRGLTPEEAVASALRAELDRERDRAGQIASGEPEPAIEEILAKIRSLGPWDGPTSAQLTSELYDAEGLSG